jgi:hypothetical protein
MLDRYVLVGSIRIEIQIARTLAFVLNPGEWDLQSLCNEGDIGANADNASLSRGALQIKPVPDHNQHQVGPL